MAKKVKVIRMENLKKPEKGFQNPVEGIFFEFELIGLNSLNFF